MSSSQQTYEIIPARPISHPILPPRTSSIQVKPPIIPQPEQPIQLTRKQKLFVEHRLSGLTERNSALKAGYSQSMADNAWQISSAPAVKKELRRRQIEQYKGQELETDEIINGWRRVVDANILDFVEVQTDGSFKVNLTGITRAQADVVEELSLDAYGRPKIRLAAKHPAREMLARYKKLFTDTDEAKGSDELTIGKLDALVRNYSQKITVNQTTINNTYPERKALQEPQVIEGSQQ